MGRKRTHPGHLTRRVSIQQRTLSAADATGERVETFSTLATVWADIEPVVGKEQLTDGAQRAIEQAYIYTHFISGVLPEMRIIYGAKTYNILSVAEVGQRAGLELLAEVVG